VALITVRANTGAYVLTLVFTQLEPYFNICALIFLNSTVEESIQSTNHANKILVSIFLTIKATFLDTQSRFCSTGNVTFIGT